MKNKSVSQLELLTLLFIGLKLTKHIEWNWFFVLLPEIIYLIIVIIASIIKHKNDASN